MRPNSRNEPPAETWMPLAKPVKTRILEALAEGPRTLRRLAHEVGLTNKGVAGECRQLIDAGLLVTVDGSTRVAADVVLTITVLGENELVRGSR